MPICSSMVIARRRKSLPRLCGVWSKYPDWSTGTGGTPGSIGSLNKKNSTSGWV